MGVDEDYSVSHNMGKPQAVTTKTSKSTTEQKNQKK